MSEHPTDGGSRSCATCRFCVTVQLPRSMQYACHYRIPATARKQWGHSEHGDSVTVEWEGNVFVEANDWCHAWEKAA